jgi:hypothetical protein
MLEGMLDKMLEWKRWADENKPEEWGFYFHNNASSVHVCLVANSYLLLLYYLVSKAKSEVWSECVVTLIYAAWTFFMLQTPCKILFYVK